MNKIKKLACLDCEIYAEDESVAINRDDFLSLKNKINEIIRVINKEVD